MLCEAKDLLKIVRLLNHCSLKYQNLVTFVKKSNKMRTNLATSWQTVLAPEFEKPYFQELQAKIEFEYQNHTCFPPETAIFAAFNHCLFDDVKVVIIGQDPYHGAGEANGLSFSVNDGVAIPPSLRNIFKELSLDLETVFMPTSGNLTAWAKQGVLLLNSTLTVRKDQANSHKQLGWATFTDAVITALSNQKEHLVFLLWGNFAQKKGIKIDTTKHKVIVTGHPSPLSANQGKWFGNHCFSATNSYLKSVSKKEIDWIL